MTAPKPTPPLRRGGGSDVRRRNHHLHPWGGGGYLRQLESDYAALQARHERLREALEKIAKGDVVPVLACVNYDDAGSDYEEELHLGPLAMIAKASLCADTTAAHEEE